MEGGSDAYWAAGRDAHAVAAELKHALFSAADGVFRRAQEVVEHEAGQPGREDVVQAAVAWGTVALTVAAGAWNVEPRVQEGLYPGEALWDPASVKPRVQEGLYPGEGLQDPAEDQTPGQDGLYPGEALRGPGEDPAGLAED